MPDFERLTDQLRLDLAQTPEQVAYARGYVKGKNQARFEVLLIVLFLAAGFVLCMPSFCHAATPNWSGAEWDKFLLTLRQTEQNSTTKVGLGAKGDNRASIGPYQIQKACYKDAAQFDKSLDKGYNTCLNDEEYSKRVVRAYVCRYGSATMTPEDAARLWNSGPKWASKKEKTEKYVKRFRKFS